MKVLVIGYTHPKYDKRVFRTVQTFAKENEVIYQYLSTKEEDSYTEKNITYMPLLYGKIREKKNFSELLKEVSKRQRFDKAVLELIAKSDYDIAYFHHFLPTKPVKAFKIAKKRGKRIIFDIHEYHPENFLKTLSGFSKRIIEKIAWNFFKKQIELSDKLIFVSEETMSDIFEKVEFRKPALVLPNYASLSVEPTEKRKEIVFVGKIQRGISKEKEILRKLNDLEIKFKVIGINSDIFKDIPHEYTSFLPYEQMMMELSKSMFSLISFSTTGNETYKNDIFSLPNKFYDSIAAGTPVIVKNTFVSMVKLVEKYGIGVVIDPSDVEGSVKKILDAFENYEYYRQNVEKCKHLFVWDEEKEGEFLEFVFKD
ncbi:MAG: glycosyltransferase [Fervidobacterium gondwanense]|uniref:glycosyltransferase n=1 Tax=Fervidobacterium gondwanense TaxID=44754 RepID=UPI003923528B